MSEVAGRDASSVTGRNIINITEEFNVDPRGITAREMRRMIKGLEVPAGEEWVLDQIGDMLKERQDMLEEGSDEEVELLQSFLDILAEV